jgi:hypothetical protein
VAALTAPLAAASMTVKATAKAVGRIDIKASPWCRRRLQLWRWTSGTAQITDNSSYRMI